MRPPYSVSKVEGSACFFSSFGCPGLTVGFALVGPLGKEFRLRISAFLFCGILGRPTASNIRTPQSQLFSLWGLGGRRTRFRSSSALLVPSLLSVAPNLTVGLSLVGPFGKEFRLGPFTFSFCGTLGSLHGFKHKNPTLAAV